MQLIRAIPGKAVVSLSLGLIAALNLAGCGGGSSSGSQMTGPTPSGFADSALVANKVGVLATATTIDANLSNPWGLVTAPGLPFWIADNNRNLATLYSGTGAIQTDTVTGSTDVGVAIPASAAGLPANPTGQVYNGSGAFLIPTAAGQEPAMFIFDGEAGTLAAWAKDSGPAAVTVYDDAVANGDAHAVYKGLALATVNGATFLYATDLHNNKVDVFDSDFSKPAALQGKFSDPTVPSGFVPFGIAALAGKLYVTYAKQDAAMHDETTGAGLGYVDVFDFGGNFVNRLASAGVLNAPWAVALAPPGFGALEGDLLVGNFGDGRINVFAPNGTATATAMGALTVTNGGDFAAPGLWSLAFGNGDADKPSTTLFYTAGFTDQTDGAFGSISFTTAAAPPNPY
jgi:uncharacterized protein (TIGR03118 family)